MNYTDIFSARGHSYNQAHLLCPAARDTERQLLLDLLELKPQDIVIDAPAGGGYVTEALHGQVASTFCIEPSPEFSNSMPASWQTYCTPIYRTPLPTACATKYASLAGLHHLSPAELQATVAEAHRLLQPGGLMAVADVQARSAQAQFLNGPVDQYTDTGHQGSFFEPGQLSRLLHDAGFHHVQEHHREFDWVFANPDQMLEFVHKLFGMTRATLSQVGTALNQYLTAKTKPPQTRLTWGLTYARGTR